MRPAPAIEALAGLTFNRVNFAADMAMFDFGPQHTKTISAGPFKGRSVLVGSHALHVQCHWRLRRNAEIIASGAAPLLPALLEPAHGHTVDFADLNATNGNLTLGLGEFRLEVLPNAQSNEQWRLLTDKPDQDHLVWEGLDGTA